MNGLAQQHTPSPVPTPGGADGAPVLNITNLSFTGAQLRNILMGIAAILGAGGFAGVAWWPATKGELTELQKVVQTIEQQGSQNRDEARQQREALRELTTSLQAIRETVVDLRVAIETRPEPVTVSAPVTRPRPRPRAPLTPPTPAPTVPR